MAFQVVMPRLGWNMEEGSVAGWRKKDGDTVAVGEILFEVESDKAVQEVEAVDSGILRIPPDSPPVGKVVPVGTVLAWLAASGEQVPSGAAVTGASPAAPGPAAAPPPTPAPPVAAPPAVPRPARGPDGHRPRNRPAISPRAKRAAGELGMSWADLHGSGSTGRIVERDVRSAAEARERVPAAAGGALAVVATEADATELLRLHGSSGGRVPPGKPSFDDLLLKLAAQALVLNPRANARFEGASATRPQSADVAIAVETDRGLAAPVIREAGAKSLRQVAQESADLCERARTGRLAPDELAGATLVVADLGAYDLDSFTPAAGAFGCAVLSVGRVVARQTVMNVETGRTEVRRMLTLALAFDARLLDPAPAARLLQTMKRYVEQPLLWLVDA